MKKKTALMILPILLSAFFSCRGNGGSDAGNNPVPVGQSMLWLTAQRGDQAGIYDSLGRQVLLRGVNFNHLGDYFQTDPSLPQVAQLGQDDFEDAAALGTNVIRLVTSWSFWEPVRGEFNQEYLQRVKDAVRDANAHGMYVVIDMHQDAWSKYVFTPVEETCPEGTSHQKGWDGAPDWATYTDGQPTCTPGAREDSPAVIRAWENFYANRDGIRDELAWVWGRIALEFANEPGVAGYDLINEPGNLSGSGIGSFIEGLTLYYQSSITAIQDAEAQAGSPGHIIFFEPSVTGALPDLNLSDYPKLVFAPHNYFESIVSGPEGLLDMSFDLYAALAVLYGDLTMWVGEYGSFSSREKNDAWMTRFAALEDSDPAGGGAWWQWEQACGDPHSVQYPPTPEWLAQQVTKCDYARFTLSRCVDRAYPMAVPGRLLSIGPGACDGHLVVNGSTGAAATADLWYPSPPGIVPSVKGTGITGLSMSMVKGGWRIFPTVSGDYSIEVSSTRIPAEIEMAGGDNQTAPIGSTLAEPLSVLATDQWENPMGDVVVEFSVTSGEAVLSKESVRTGDDGLASASLTFTADTSDVEVIATVTGLTPVTFHLHPRWPLLGEVAAASIDGVKLADMPVLMADLDDGKTALVLIFGDAPDLDLSFLPTAGNLAGATIGGTPTENFVAVFLPAESISTDGALIDPAVGQVSGVIVGDYPVEFLAAVTGFTMMSEPVALGIAGDPSSLPPGLTLMPLGNLIASGPPATDLPLVFIDPEKFPSDPDNVNPTFMPTSEVLVPTFTTTVELIGGTDASSVPVLGAGLSVSGSTTTGLSNGNAPLGPVIGGSASISDTYLPLKGIRQIGNEFIPVAEIYLNEIVPLKETAEPVKRDQGQLVLDLISALDNNVDLIMGLFSGGSFDATGVFPLATELLPALNGLIQNEISLQDIQLQQLIIYRDEIIPALTTILQTNDILFGGTSDGNPSSVRDDLLPFLSAELDILINAYPTIEQLLSDLDAFIPDQVDMVSLLTWYFNLDANLLPVLEDLNALLPYMIDGLTVLSNQGFGILNDMLEQVEATVPPGTKYIGDMDFFINLEASIDKLYGPDATVGDVGLLRIVFPLILGLLPPDLFPPGEDPLTMPLQDLTSLLGGLDIVTSMPLLKMIVNMLETAMPGLIDTLGTLDFTTIELPF